jgi:hypothetical protein
MTLMFHTEELRSCEGEIKEILGAKAKINGD